jgi:hypothetical protein
VYKNSASKLNLIPTSLQVVSGNGNLQNGLADYSSLQNTTSVSSASYNGESNNFNLASFSSGSGFGTYTKNLSLSLAIPPYIKAQSYTGSLICSVS